MLNNNDTITAQDLATALRVVRAAGVPEHAREDVVQDAVVRVLSANFDATKGSMSNYLAKTAKNLALNWKRDNRRPCVSVCDTDQGDWETSAGDREEGVQLAAPAGLTPEIAEQIAALEALEGEERAFVEALALGCPAVEAGALVGWSEAKASRKRREIAERVGR